MKTATLLCATATAGVLAILPQTLRAQTPAAQQSPAAGASCTDASGNAQPCSAPDQEPAATTDVVVTGSRIARPNLTSTVPITSVTGEDLEQTGRVSTGDVLNDLPALQSTFSQANSTRFLGTAGLNLLDLRGLGTQRTLVMVNGRRHVGSDILNNAVSPDVNTFPTDLIERVDVVTGGNSAVYGSDAIAGVVNFVLKDHFDGLQLKGQGGVSQEGDAGSYYASLLAGRNFAGSRGNVAINLEYARQNRLYASQRSDLQQNNGFVAVDTEAFDGNVVNGSDGNPDSVFFRDIRSATIYSGGLLAFASPTGACGRDNQTQGSFVGRPFTCNFIFTSDGRLVAQTGTRVGLSSIASSTTATATPGGAFIGGNGNTRREGELVQILPQLDRYSANLVGHFEVSPAVVPFVEAKYVRTDVVGMGGNGPAFFTGSTLDGLYERPRFDNPYLSDQARAVIQAQRAAGGLAPATAATRLVLRRNLVDLGVRTEESTRETYRLVGGVRGEIGDGLRYEVAANYGRFDERTKILGNLNIQRFLLGMDSTRNAAGQIVCAAQLDPSRANAGFGTPGQDLGGNPSVLAADIAACQPINPFGEGNISEAAKRYILSDTVVKAGIRQFDATAFVSGDTRSFFELPGGPVGFAIGGEYRSEVVHYLQDPLVSQGYTFYNAITEFDAPTFAVKEAYGELRLPLLKDLPFVRELTLSGAARVSDYRISAGTVWAYNAGVDYAPIEDVHLRAAYARAVRSPNLTDLYFPAAQNFAGSFVDPCALNNINSGSTNRASNCRAAGVPTTFNYIYAQSLEIRSGGNLASGGSGLKSETSDSYTYGAVIQPRSVPGLSLSVDYFNIKVNDVITSPSAQQIVNSCYDSPTTANQFCGLFQRAGAAGGPNGEEPGRIIEGSLLTIPLNYAALRTRGIDAELAYRHRFGDATVSTKVVYTHTFEGASFLDPTQPGFGNTVRGELGSPKDAFNWDVDVTAGRVFANYQLRFIGRQDVFAYEATHSYQGRAPENADAGDILQYPSVTYMDIRTGVNIGTGSNFYLGIDNFTNTKPPLSSTGIGGGSGIFEPVGRRFYAGVTARF